MLRLIIEVHDDPENAWSDGAQSLKPKRYAELVEKEKLSQKLLEESYKKLHMRFLFMLECFG